MTTLCSMTNSKSSIYSAKKGFTLVFLMNRNIYTHVLMFLISSEPREVLLEGSIYTHYCSFYQQSTTLPTIVCFSYRRLKIRQ